MAKRKKRDYSAPAVRALTAREKKDILEAKTFCHKCGDNTLAVLVNNDGVPLCRIHGGN